MLGLDYLTQKFWDYVSHSRHATLNQVLTNQYWLPAWVKLGGLLGLISHGLNRSANRTHVFRWILDHSSPFCNPRLPNYMPSYTRVCKQPGFDWLVLLTPSSKHALRVCEGWVRAVLDMDIIRERERGTEKDANGNTWNTYTSVSMAPVHCST